MMQKFKLKKSPQSIFPRHALLTWRIYGTDSFPIPVQSGVASEIQNFPAVEAFPDG